MTDILKARLLALTCEAIDLADQLALPEAGIWYSRALDAIGGACVNQTPAPPRVFDQLAG